LAEGYSFLSDVNDALYQGLFRLVTLESDEELRLYREILGGLHRGEAMSLAMALARGWRFMTDDRAARHKAHQLAVPYSGTLGLLRYAVQTGTLTLVEANALLGAMVALARYHSPIDDISLLLDGE
jgi:predicted nucleic acid-binding protein